MATARLRLHFDVEVAGSNPPSFSPWNFFNQFTGFQFGLAHEKYSCLIECIALLQWWLNVALKLPGKITYGSRDMASLWTSMVEQASVPGLKARAEF